MNAVATSSMGSETLQAALWFAEHDIPVFPCHYPEGLNGCSCHDPRCTSQGKHPLTRHGFLDATTDLQQIREWWEQWPEANLAIPTGTLSGLLVVDFDPRDGAPSDRDGCAEVIGRIPDNAAEATSGGNGRHIYFQYNPALFPWKIPQYIAPGVEVKATGDYVITAPSRHVSGKRYEWDGMEGRNHLLRLPSPTPTLIEKINTAARQKPTLPAEERIWGQGERNNQLTRLAGAMRRHGTSAGVIETALQEANRKQCNPPLGEEEVRQISLSVSRYAPAQVAPDYVIREESNSSNGTRPAPVRTESAAAGKRCPVSAGSDELFSGEYPKVASMIDKILYPGVTLLQSPPKFGKSYWALQASLNLIEGTAFMDYFEVPKKLRVLYVDIEGTKGRAHERLNQLGRADRELTQSALPVPSLRPLAEQFTTDRRGDQEVGKRAGHLRYFTGIAHRVLVTKEGYRAEDYDNIDKIREICARNNASALVVSHAKKHTAGMAATDAGIHSTGTSASVDSLITLKRSGNGNVTLEVLPRDGEPGEYEIQLDPENHQGWHLLGFGADVGQSRERRAILNVFREAGKPLTPHDVAVALGKNDSTIRTLIQKLASDGKLESLGKGLYRFEEVKP
jgi:hypothetical protein